MICFQLRTSDNRYAVESFLHFSRMRFVVEQQTMTQIAAELECRSRF